MEELKLRLEYLEQVSQAPEQQDSMLGKVDAIGDTLNEMLGVRQQEVKRMARKVRAESEARGFGSSAQVPADHSEVPVDVQRRNIEAQSEIFARLAAILAEESMALPPPIPAPMESAANQLIAKASALGQEFDELTLRSTELTKRLLEQIAAENQARGQKTAEA